MKPVDTLEGDAVGATPAGGQRVVVFSTLALVLSLAAWAASLASADPREMTDVGLLSVLPPLFYVGLGISLVSYLLLLEAAPHFRLVRWGHLLALATMAHGTPAVLYGTLRYSWSYKHVGVVDYIQRTGELDPDIAFLDIYHSWPGLFSFTALLSDLSGVHALTLATWTPLFLTFVNLLAVTVLFRAFTTDERVIGMGTLLFLVANWVGQEYFSPQGFTFFLYLSVLAVVIPLERMELPKTWFAQLQSGAGPSPRGGHQRTAVMAFLVAIVLVIVASHQLSPIMIVASLTIVASLRRSRTGWLAVTAAAMMLGWLAGPAWTYFQGNLLGGLDTLGSPTQTTSSSVLDTTSISPGQVFVVLTDRALALLVVLLCALGIRARLRQGHRDILPIALLVAPAVLLASDYGGEVLFRVYLFAVPWLALFAAFALVGSGHADRSISAIVARMALVSILMAGFLFAYLGKEQFNYFTPAEVEAAEWVYENAPPNTILIEGSRNYPGQFLNYENFFFVPIAREDRQTQAEIREHPAEEMARWLDNDRFAAAYLIITRSQIIEASGLGDTLPGLLEEIEQALLASDRFAIAYSNADAIVFELAGAQQ